MSEVDQTQADVSFDQAAAEVGGTDEVFFHEYGDGESKLRFKTPDELNSHLAKTINFESDYTRKSQAREKDYKDRMAQIEKDRQEFTSSRENWEKTEKAKYDRYNEALQRRPAIQAQLERMVNTPVSPDEAFQRSRGYADTKYSELEKRLNEMDEKVKQEQLEKQTEGIYAELEQQYPDFNRDKVREALANLDGNDPKALLDMMWRATRDPAQMREQVEANIAKKAGAGMLHSGGGSPPRSNKGSTDPKAVNEEAQAWANS